MTPQYKTLNVKLSNSHLDKVKSGIENGAKVIGIFHKTWLEFQR